MIFIDPYYEISQIALFKSTKRLDWARQKDTVIKSMFYQSKGTAELEIKCCIQFPASYDVKVLKDVIEDHSNRGYDSELDSESSTDSENEEIGFV